MASLKFHSPQMGQHEVLSFKEGREVQTLVHVTIADDHAIVILDTGKTLLSMKVKPDCAVVLDDTIQI